MDTDLILEEVKRSIGLDDDQTNVILTDFINRTMKQLNVRLGFPETLPSELDYIVTEVTINRFNRIGDEGANSYSQDGQSINYKALFADFEHDINEWIIAQEKKATPKKGVVRFL